ncbi:MAG: copper homeostasis protein CutC [Rhodanobacteraceae bacterium]
MNDPRQFQKTGVLEIAANSAASALAAQAGGATRVELCAALELGGLTPSHATIAITRERLGIPIHVLVRPRAGDFVYDDTECEAMLRDIEDCKARGCDGVVLGVLDTDGNVDVQRSRALIEAARGMAVTFHRAFDVARNPERSLEDVIALGCQRLLTSGQRADALAGAPLIRELVERARGRIEVMAGAGITPGNIAAIASASGTHAFHASAKQSRASSMRLDGSNLPGLTGPSWHTDVQQVRALVGALQALSANRG